MDRKEKFLSVIKEKGYEFVENYELDESIKLGDELNLYLNNFLKKLNKESDSYEDDYEMIKFALIFVELNQDRLNERSW